MVVSFIAPENYSMLNVAAQTGVQQPFYYRTGGDYPMKSTVLHIAFGTLPAPVLTSLFRYNSDPGCILEPAGFRDCTAGLSQMFVQGTHLFSGARFTVGGIDVSRQIYLVPTTGTTIGFWIVMPAYNFTEGVFYDIMVTTQHGSFIWPLGVEFNTESIISQLTPCVLPTVGMRYHDSYVRCMPGEKLYLSVMNVANPTSPGVFLTSSPQNNTVVECQDAIIIDDSQLYCTMPPIPGNLCFNQFAINVWFDIVMTHPVLSQPTFEYSDAPRISSISGCYSNSGNQLHVNQCLAGYSAAMVLTLHGVRLSGDWTVQFDMPIGSNQFTFASPVTSAVSVDDQTFVCTLAPFDNALLVSDLTYSIVLKSENLVSNAANVTFVEKVNQDPESSSKASALTLSLATVFSVVGACVLLYVAIAILRRSRRSKNSSPQFTDERSNLGTNVELSDV